MKVRCTVYSISLTRELKELKPSRLGPLVLGARHGKHPKREPQLLETLNLQTARPLLGGKSPLKRPLPQSRHCQYCKGGFPKRGVTLGDCGGYTGFRD